MVLGISQETFDDAVRENINEFDMSTEEAIKETIEQFTAQGVDLSHIVTDWMMAASINSPALVEAITKLGNLVSGSTKDPKEYISQLVIIRTECEKGLNYQVMAGKEGAYKVIMDVMLKFESNVEITKECLQTLISLMTKHPDLLDTTGVQMIIKYLDNQKNCDILRLVLKWTKECCVLHETNRQNIFDAAILDHLKPLLHDANSAMLRDVLSVLRALVLDDDVRLEFGRAHEHARVFDLLAKLGSYQQSRYRQHQVVYHRTVILESLQQACYHA